MHPHQVAHGQCCDEGWVRDCTGGCLQEEWVGDNVCDNQLMCYCEEESDCDGHPPVPVCSLRWARCQHPYTVAGAPLRAHLVMHGVTGLLYG